MPTLTCLLNVNVIKVIKLHREQCIENDVPFRFHQTGANLLKDGKNYRIKRKYQISQALKAGINYK